MIKTVVEKDINIIKKDFLKRLLVVSIIITNIFFYIPNITFAATKDSNEKVPATVPAAANEIISKFVSVKTSSVNTSSTGKNIITNNTESGDGWSSTTEVSSSGTTRTYRNYKQYEGSYAGNHYWQNIIKTDGCGPTAVAIVLSGYGYDYNPGQVVKIMQDELGYDSSDSFEHLTKTLKHIGNIEAEEHDGFTQEAVQQIRNNLNAGRPVIVNVPNHYVTYIGENEDGLIISDPGAQDGGNDKYGKTVEDLVNNANSDKDYIGYILIKSDGNAASNNSSTSKSSSDTDKKSSDSSKSSSKTEDKSSSNPTGTGEAKIEKCNLENGGYDAIFTSGTTGRQFKEYKQDISGWDSKYNITRCRLFMDFRMWNS